LLIVFDLDDTLIDTSGVVTPYKIRSIIMMLEREKISLPPDGVIQLTELNEQCTNTKDAVRIFLERHSAAHLFPKALEVYTAPLPKDFSIPTTPGAQKVLKLFKKKKTILALVTGGSPSFQREKLEKAGFEPSIFSKIAIPEDSIKGPHYQALLKEFSLLPRDAMVVGDRVRMDLAPAHDLGMKTVHMRWGRGLREQTEKWIDRSITSLEELMEG
jgi:FMN phosphatase YigB (HAD superfamily)